MTNVTVAVYPLYPNGSIPNEGGYKIGILPSSDRAAQNDTITISNATEVVIANLRDTDDTLETMTYATNVITMTRSDTTAVTGIVVYK